MTDAEDEYNAFLNEQIRACKHERIGWYEGRIRCGGCPARFGVVMFPRRAKPFCVEPDEDRAAQPGTEEP